MFKEQAKNEKTELMYRLHKDFPKYVFGDSTRVQQVLTNLVKNALKFTKRGFIKIIASYISQFEMVKIAVEDTGHGISKEDQQLLFKQFGKLETSAHMNEKGIGLGLFICKKLVQQMGGEIEVESEEGKGSIFTFTINMKQV